VDTASPLRKAPEFVIGWRWLPIANTVVLVTTRDGDLFLRAARSLTRPSTSPPHDRPEGKLRKGKEKGVEKEEGIKKENVEIKMVMAHRRPKRIGPVGRIRRGLPTVALLRSGVRPTTPRRRGFDRKGCAACCALVGCRAVGRNYSRRRGAGWLGGQRFVMGNQGPPGGEWSPTILLRGRFLRALTRDLGGKQPIHTTFPPGAHRLT